MNSAIVCIQKSNLASHLLPYTSVPIMALSKHCVCLPLSEVAGVFGMPFVPPSTPLPNVALLHDGSADRFTVR